MKIVRRLFHAGLWLALIIGIAYLVDARWRVALLRAEQKRALDFFGQQSHLSPQHGIQFAKLELAEDDAYLYRIIRPTTGMVLRMENRRPMNYEPETGVEDFPLTPGEDFTFDIGLNRKEYWARPNIPGRHDDSIMVDTDASRFLDQHLQELLIKTIDSDGDFPTDQRQIKTLMQIVIPEHLRSTNKFMKRTDVVLRIRLGTQAAFAAEQNSTGQPGIAAQPGIMVQP